MVTAKLPTLRQATVLSLKRNQRSSKSSNLNLKSNCHNQLKIFKEIHHHQSKIIKKAAFYRDIFILVYVHENLVKHSIILH